MRLECLVFAMKDEIEVKKKNNKKKCFLGHIIQVL